MRTFDFGLFLPIANNGMIASTAYQYMPTFALNKVIALTAEELDYSFIFSMTKWRGYGGTTQHWDHAKELFSLMSGLAAVTDRIQPCCIDRPADASSRCRSSHGGDIGRHQQRPSHREHRGRLEQA